jgi:hypothetical protein
MFDAALRAASNITLKTAASAALLSGKQENAEQFRSSLFLTNRTFVLY